MSIATFVHVSDLHFGAVDPRTLSGSALRNLQWAPGMFGHDGAVLARAVDLVERLRHTDSARVVFTGDLTADGEDEQFDLGRTFFDDVLTPPRGNFIGLRETDWAARAIPGNHDHWRGIPFTGPAGAAMRATFPPLPSAETLDVAGGLQLTWILVDTDADVVPGGLDVILARGAFESQLEALDPALPRKSPREIRVLLAHHSLSHRGTTLRMRSASLRRLVRFIADHDIHVVLSGHVHEPSVRVIPEDLVASRPEFLEARCGTTGQRVSPPTAWLEMHPYLAGIQGAIPNTLLVHRIEDDPAGVFWTTQTIAITRHGTFPLTGPGTSARIRVLP